ncbi:hypothetical protein C922_05210 [Plasmodium inui San Antonio 1]|uniref:Uncharacterized protein n=1 Tax=Plasmodium inui San Antonio 1 TaxID=1237626 RepID=W7AGH3_9APIC|nr:hypothetical protein C922_05210 [Plasmodium inui San Antonio 1]EUD64411.1 hypothetical protein C922_05210 [Plasmodium inui San Antonio 1]
MVRNLLIGNSVYYKRHGGTQQHSKETEPERKRIWDIRHDKIDQAIEAPKWNNKTYENGNHKRIFRKISIQSLLRRGETEEAAGRIKGREQEYRKEQENNIPIFPRVCLYRKDPYEKYTIVYYNLQED